MSRAPQELVEVNTRQLDDLLRRAEQSLDPADFELTQAIFQSYAYLADLVEDKNTSLRRLRQLLFGQRTEKTETVTGDARGAREPQPTERSPSGESFAANVTPVEEVAPVKGHGRNGADAYQGGERIVVSHPTLEAGDDCPTCGQGTLYDYTPGVLVRIVGQPPLHSRVYELQKLRCHLCGQLFAAEPPAEAGGEKYVDCRAEAVAAMSSGRAAELPQRLLKPAAERLERFRITHRHPLPVGERQHEVVQQMIKRLAVDGDPQAIHAGEIGGGQVSRMMDLGKHHRPARTMLAAPLTNPPLEGSPLRIGIPTGILILQPLEHRDRSQSWFAFPPCFDLGPHVGERVLPRPIVA